MQQSSAPSYAAGVVVGSRFRLERKLGEGGMGEVFEAVDLQTDARIALKLMRRELADDDRAVERFRREGAALAVVQHPAIVQIREVGELDDGTLYLAMELLEGENLSVRLGRVGPMPPAQLLSIVRSLCDGLSAAHAAGIVHRDIKPSNIHLPDGEGPDQDGPGAQVKLVDFGVARVRGFSKMTSSGLAVGTVRYMAPEQLSGAAVDERADLYALGVVLYEALSGEHPFERTSGEDPIGAVLVGRATPLSSLRPDLSPAITRVVHKAMARLATERFASARALADAFGAAVHAPPGSAPELTAQSPARPAPMDPALAETALARPAPSSAPSEIPSQSQVRPKRSTAKKKRRPPVYLLLPLLVGACLVPTFGIAGFVGCGSWMTDLQVRIAMQSVRSTIDEDPVAFAPYAASLGRLEALHEQDRVNLFAAAAFNKRVQDALQRDGRVSRDELPRIIGVVDDIVARGGEYDIDTYTKMAEPN